RIDDAVLHDVLAARLRSIEQQRPPAKRLGGIDKQEGRFAVDPVGTNERRLTYPPLAQIDDHGTDKTDKEHDNSAIGQGYQAVPGVGPRTLVDVAIRAADRVEAVTPFGADRGIHHRPADQAKEHDGHDHPGQYDQGPTQSGDDNVAQHWNHEHNAVNV